MSEPPPPLPPPAGCKSGYTKGQRQRKKRRRHSAAAGQRSKTIKNPALDMHHKKLLSMGIASDWDSKKNKF